MLALNVPRCEFAERFVSAASIAMAEEFVGYS